MSLRLGLSCLIGSGTNGRQAHSLSFSGSGSQGAGGLGWVRSTPALEWPAGEHKRVALRSAGQAALEVSGLGRVNTFLELVYGTKGGGQSLSLPCSQPSTLNHLFGREQLLIGVRGQPKEPRIGK